MCYFISVAPVISAETLQAIQGIKMLSELAIFQVYLFSNETNFLREVWINSTVSELYIHHIDRHLVYRLRISAFNKIGEGPLSDILFAGKLSDFVHFDNSHSISIGIQRKIPKLSSGGQFLQCLRRFKMQCSISIFRCTVDGTEERNWNTEQTVDLLTSFHKVNTSIFLLYC